MGARKRCAIVGTGLRATVYSPATLDWNKDDVELVALCDKCQTRMDWHNKQIVEVYKSQAVPTFTDFDEMLKEARPDVVIITTPDYTHHEYICRALEAGLDVHCEKPMTVNVETTRKVLEAAKKAKGRLVVSQNLRYSNLYKKVKDLIEEGTIGEIKFATLDETLDSSHGADSFRRWHRDIEKSGGFMIQKSSHHFDLVNWWVKSRPKTVFAIGDLLFYGKESAKSRGIEQSYERYHGVQEAQTDPFAINLEDNPYNKGLYLDAEKDSDYIRDKNVFGDGITIDDTISLSARYHNGVIFSYTLVAYGTYDGLKTTLTGTKGRIELEESYGPHIIDWAEDGKPKSRRAQTSHLKLTVHPMFKEPYEIDIPQGGDGHGGGDLGISKASFSANPTEEQLADLPNALDGAATCLLGIAANMSIETGKPIDCDEILPLEEYM